VRLFLFAKLATRGSMRAFPLSGILLTAFLVVPEGVATTDAAAQPVSLDVAFKLTDLDYKPIANAPVRVVFGSEKGWLAPGAGRKIVTDAKGEARFSAPVTLERRMKKKPTSFAASLVTTPQSTEFLQLGAEMEYAGFRWLYVIAVYRFPDGDSMLDEFDVYTTDDKGAFTRKAKHEPKGGGWLMADLNGMALTTPGYDAYDFMLTPDPADKSGQRWRLDVSFKRYPAPVVR
jgi:hypothetical protein